jgi:hypothetical protein
MEIEEVVVVVVVVDGRKASRSCRGQDIYPFRRFPA